MSEREEKDAASLFGEVREKIVKGLRGVIAGRERWEEMPVEQWHELAELLCRV